MAVRLQMKLGLVPEQTASPDSPDAIVPVEPTIGSIAPSKGNLYLLVTAAHRVRACAEATRLVAGDDPDRVLLRRVGRDPRLPREGDQTANKRLGHQPIGSAEATGANGPIGVAVGGRPRQRAVRRDRRSGRGLPHPPGSAVDAAGSAPRARPALDRARAGRLAGRDLVGDSLVLASPNLVGRLGPMSSRTRWSPSTRSRRWSTSTTGSSRPTGTGSDGAIAFEATEVSATSRSGRSSRSSRRSPSPAPRTSPDPPRRQRQRRGAAVQQAAASARAAAGGASDRFDRRRPGPAATRRKPAYRRVTPLASRRETQRRAAVAALALIVVVGLLGLGVSASRRPWRVTGRYRVAERPARRR